MTAQKNDGTQLENIVEIIEAMRLPLGFKVEKRHKVHNEEGVQIAELDIIISGPVGTATCTMLIECRDRPSEGAAPASWIEQLAGRRNRFKLDKVMAVSSTGFAPGAVDYANEEGIELRTFQNLTYDEVSQWVSFYAPVIINSSHFCGLRIGLSSPDLPEELEGTAKSIDLNDRCIIDNATKVRLSLRQLWNRITTGGKYHEGLTVNGEKRKQKVVVDEATMLAYTVELEGFAYQLCSLEFDAEFWLERSNMPLVQAGTYIGDKGRILDIARWQGQPTDNIREMLVIGVRKQPPESCT